MKSIIPLAAPDDSDSDWSFNFLVFLEIKVAAGNICETNSNSKYFLRKMLEMNLATMYYRSPYSDACNQTLGGEVLIDHRLALFVHLGSPFHYKTLHLVNP